jgi:leader peptidase (prepilin peptidase)/N-methyltransferase
MDEPAAATALAAAAGATAALLTTWLGGRSVGRRAGCREAPGERAGGAGAALAAGLAVLYALGPGAPSGAGGVPAGALAGAFIALTLRAAALDLRYRIIPNRLTYPAILLGLATALVLPGRTWTATLLGGAVMLALYLPPALAGGGWLGMGDVKLGLALGLFLAFPVAVFAVVVTAVLGGVAAAVLALRHRDRRATLPYGPWLAAGSLLALAGVRLIAGLRPLLG